MAQSMSFVLLLAFAHLAASQDESACAAGNTCSEAELQMADDSVSPVTLLQMDQGAALRHQLKETNEVKFGSSTSCEATCQYQPASAWATQTACCSCGGHQCACSCSAYCQYEPASSWSTQTGCCGCQSLLEESSREATMEGLQELYNKSSANKENAGIKFGSSTSCAAFCQYEPASSWATETSCCGCNGGKCACICGPECQYQPSSAWATQTDCCGCSSLAQKDAVAADVSEHVVAQEKSADLDSNDKNKADKVAFGASASCESWCQYQPASSWATQTGCCSCGGHQCACSCSSYCQYEPASSWSTQTGCCGCQSLLENSTSEEDLIEDEQTVHKIGEKAGWFWSRRRAETTSVADQYAQEGQQYADKYQGVGQQHANQYQGVGQQYANQYAGTGQQYANQYAGAGQQYANQYAGAGQQPANSR